MPDTCKTCRWFVPFDHPHGDGECHGHPPNVVGMPEDSDTERPTVECSDPACSLHRLAPAQSMPGTLTDAELGKVEVVSKALSSAALAGMTVRCCTGCGVLHNMLGCPVCTLRNQTTIALEGKQS